MRSIFKSIFMAVAALTISSVLFTSCNCCQKHETYVINHFEDNPYLAEIWWGDDYDPEVAAEHLNNRYLPTEGGACSSWHKDNFHGRNIDWNMRDFATVIMHMPRTDKVKYASVSLMAGNPAVTKDFIDNNASVPEEMRAWLPAVVVDGMNECGVAINHNIVPWNGEDYISTGDIATTMVCRYVLDNCATAAEAVELLKSTKVYQSVVKLAHDYSHFFISDPTSSYVVEWIDKQFVATEFKADGNGNYVSANGEKAIMTNYFVGQAEKYGLGSQAFFLNHPAAAGVERAETIERMLPDAATAEDHLNICKAVWYRQFCLGKTDWATENEGAYGFDGETGKSYWEYPAGTGRHYMDNDDIYGAAIDLMHSDNIQAYYEDFIGGWDKISADNSYWFTQHSVVYDVKNLKCYLIMQEGLLSDKVVEFGIK